MQEVGYDSPVCLQPCRSGALTQDRSAAMIATPKQVESTVRNSLKAHVTGLSGLLDTSTCTQDPPTSLESRVS
ncbi:hypothetical protein J6590_060777 [Homalodisca vitripennis]|nr:hypothetical protein J6590_060777 [Homalodisca vitripennis]